MGRANGAFYRAIGETHHFADEDVMGFDKARKERALSLPILRVRPLNLTEFRLQAE